MASGRTEGGRAVRCSALIGGVALVLALPAPAQTMSPEALSAPPGADPSAVLVERYRCERGVEVPVVFVNAPQGGYAVVQIDGRQVAMAQAVSGSGIRYRGIDPDLPYLLLGKGDTARFLFGPDEVVVLDDCRAVP